MSASIEKCHAGTADFSLLKFGRRGRENAGQKEERRVGSVSMNTSVGTEREGRRANVVVGCAEVTQII